MHASLHCNEVQGIIEHGSFDKDQWQIVKFELHLENMQQCGDLTQAHVLVIGSLSFECTCSIDSNAYKSLYLCCDFIGICEK